MAPTSEPLAYNTNLRADISSEVNEKPKARVHSTEWAKIQNGDPVEINPSVGYGYKVNLDMFLRYVAFDTDLDDLNPHPPTHPPLCTSIVLDNTTRMLVSKTTSKEHRSNLLYIERSQVSF